MIKKGRLTEYVKGGKRDKKESLKGKPPLKIINDGTNEESKEAIKVKRSYIATITGGDVS